jgi:hypothetical protein
VDTAAIIDGLTHYERLPVSTIEAARAERAAVVPEFLRLIEEHLAREGGSEAEHDSLFLIFHLLGEWRETSAYRPLSRLLRLDGIDSSLGDAVTVTMHQVMAAVFDGDPQPLYEIILDREADEFIRAMTFKSLTTLVLEGELQRAEVARFLATCASDLDSDRQTFAWVGWAEAIATLGLEELRPSVKRVFDADLIEPFIMRLTEFDEGLAYALEHPEDRAGYWGAKLSRFGDAVAELSDWASFSEENEENQDRKSLDDLKDSETAAMLAKLIQAAQAKAKTRADPDTASIVRGPVSPFVNPSRSIGRNDPCPCGSGKKYKKCCLN